MTNRQRVAIVGGGITGLAVALELLEQKILKQGDLLTLFDAGSAPGGCVSAERQNGFLCEWAAQGVLASRPHFVKRVEGLSKEASASLISNSSRARKRFLITPSNTLMPISLLPFPFLKHKMLTFVQYLRIFCDVVLPRQTISNETLFEFFARRFGSAFAKRMVVPMATGIWAGGAREILVQHAFPSLVEMEHKHRSLFLAALISLLLRRKEKSTLKGLLSFSNGMSQFPLAMWQKIQKECEHGGVELKAHWNTTAKSIQGNTKTLETSVGSYSFDHLFWCASPLHASDMKLEGATLTDFSAAWRNFCDDVAARNVVVVGVGGPRLHQVPQGFGSLAPEESKDLLGCLNVHDIYPQHVPKGCYLYRVLLGGDRDPNLITRNPEALQELAVQRLRDLGLLHVDEIPSFLACKIWKKSIVVGNETWKSRAEELRKNAPKWLHLAGSYIGGAGVEDCLVSAKKAVTEGSFT
jgi:protoporphyrinogen/coproporphyrinogen III oxidase